MDELDELSLAQAIVDAAVGHADGRRVARVEVRLGELCGVTSESLELGFSLLTSGTALDGTEFEIDLTPGGELVVDAIELEREPTRNERIDRGSHV